MSIFDRWDKTPPSDVVPDILPLYCGRCGKRLERVTQALGYSTQTGAEQFQYWLSCPDAERKETPYIPSTWTGRARFVTCDLKAWAEKKSPYSSLDFRGFVSCEPWPKPERVTLRATKAKTP